MAKINEIVTQAESEASLFLTVREVEARERFNAESYAAQVTWHNTNERLVRQYQDSQEDAAEIYRAAIRQAQRAFRDATADLFGDD
jgi:hypothetical protein